MTTAETDQFQNQLGPVKTIELSAGRLRYRDHGTGRPVVFLAGLLLHGGFWRKVVPPIREPIRALVPDLPLGAHSVPLRKTADLSPTGLADLIVEFMDALVLEDPVIVANDTGGALAQILVARDPERVSGLVLTPCDAFENFLPPTFRSMQLMARLPGGMSLLAQTLRLRFLRSSPLAFGRLTARRLDHAVYDSYLLPARVNRGVRRDLAKVLRGISKRYTVEAAKRLAAFDRPVLIAWPKNNPHFPFVHAEKLAATFPSAALVEVADSRTYVPEDQPKVLAQLIDQFLAEQLAPHDGRDAGPGGDVRGTANAPKE